MRTPSIEVPLKILLGPSMGQRRSTQRILPREADDEQALTDDSMALARQYGRYGYRRVTALLFTATVENEFRSDQLAQASIQRI